MLSLQLASGAVVLGALWNLPLMSRTSASLTILSKILSLEEPVLVLILMM
jgi:hypothetical protein